MAHLSAILLQSLVCRVSVYRSSSLDTNWWSLTHLGDEGLDSLIDIFVAELELGSDALRFLGETHTAWGCVVESTGLVAKRRLRTIKILEERVLGW